MRPQYAQVRASCLLDEVCRAPPRALRLAYAPILNDRHTAAGCVGADGELPLVPQETARRPTLGGS